MSSDAVCFSCRPKKLASCTVATLSARCSATRAGLSRPCRTNAWRESSSFLKCFARRRSWDFLLPFAGLFPRMGERAISGARAHVSFRTPRIRPD